jgi:hypothetical protein
MSHELKDMSKRGNIEKEVCDGEKKERRYFSRELKRDAADLVVKREWQRKVDKKSRAIADST